METLPTASEMLRDELVERRRRNRLYSLRAFARDLEVSSSFLCLVMNGRKRLTEKSAANLLHRLTWDSLHQKAFLVLVRLDQTKDPEHRKRVLEELKPILGQNGASDFVLPVDKFRLMSRWHHQAICELARTKNFDSQPKAIAKRLGLTVIEVEVAIDRLMRLGLLHRVGKTLRPIDTTIQVEEMSSQAIRSHHGQILDLAKSALAEQHPDVRDFSSVTMAIDPKMLPEARKKIRNCYRDVMVLLESGNRTQLYQLGIQLFRLDKYDGIEKSHGDQPGEAQPAPTLC